MKIFTIGDSISQGFMSGAAARTEQSYSSIIAKVLKVTNYNIPQWDKGGFPANIETVFRRLEKKLGANISGPIEWIQALNVINQYLDTIEDYYERGEGYYDPQRITKQPFHNVSIRGFDIASSWLINPKLCHQFIEASPNKKDNWFGLVDESMLRTAKIVLETGSQNVHPNPSQIDWLKYHHENEGVENLFLWLGANNALGTVLTLDIVQTSNDGSAFINGPDKISFKERRSKKWNLWHPEDFRVEYKFTLDKIVEIMENGKKTDYKIFVGTIPLVTICPLIKGVGKTSDRDNITVTEWHVNQQCPAPIGLDELTEGTCLTYSYAKYYPYFAFADNFDLNTKHLNQSKILHIDNIIRKYNRIIQELVALANKSIGSRKIYLVDIAKSLSDMALKRNSYNPAYKFPKYFEYAYPKVDTRYYGTNREGTINSGGIFSLDGVHPTAIGQGLIAYEFLKVMKIAGSYNGNVQKDIDWNSIFNSDSLYSNPIGLLGEIYDNIDLKKWLFNNIF